MSPILTADATGRAKLFRRHFGIGEIPMGPRKVVIRARWSSINYKDAPDNAQAFLTELGSPYKLIGADRNGRQSIDFGVYGVPETFVIDGQGKIRFKLVGPILERNIEKVRAAIKAALEGAQAAPDLVDEVIMGCVLPAGQGQAPARQAGLSGPDGSKYCSPCSTSSKGTTTS